MGWAKKAEAVFYSVLGDGITEGIIFELLEAYTPTDVLRCIEENKTIMDISESERSRMRKHLEHINWGKYTSEYILGTLYQERPDLHKIIGEHPKGIAWLEAQVQEVKGQLSSSWVRV